MQSYLSLFLIVCFLLLNACKDDEDSSQQSPLAPSNTFAHSGVGISLALDQNFLVVGIKDNGVVLYDIAPAERPLLIDTIALPHVYNVFIKDKQVFLFDEKSGLNGLSLENFNQLNLVLGLSNVELSGFVEDLLWFNNHLLVGNQTAGLSVYNVEEKFSLNGGVVPLESPLNSQVKDIETLGSSIITISHDGNIIMIDGSDLENLLVKSWLVTSYRPVDFMCSGESCYLTDLEQGFIQLSMTGEGGPREVQRIGSDLIFQKIKGHGENLILSYISGLDSFGLVFFEPDANGKYTETLRIPLNSKVVDLVSSEKQLFILLKNGDLLTYPMEQLL